MRWWVVSGVFWGGGWADGSDGVGLEVVVDVKRREGMGLWLRARSWNARGERRDLRGRDVEGVVMVLDIGFILSFVVTTERRKGDIERSETGNYHQKQRKLQADLRTAVKTN